MPRRLHSRALLISTALTLAAASAHAFPGVFVDKRGAERVNRSTHVVMMQKENATVITLAPDYDGPTDPFALVVPVPSDVTLDRIKTLKREVIGRIEELTAPRFHEFYESDPCDPEPAQQEWERDLRVKDTGFLGGNQEFGPKKVDPAMVVNLATTFKDADGEYKYTLFDEAQSKDFEAAFGGLGYKVSPKVKQSLQAYVDKGQRLLVAEVDPGRIELAAQGVAQLGGVRFWTEQPYSAIASTLGLNNIKSKQDLLLYVIHPDKRWETKNYKVVFPPTNLESESIVKLNGKDRFVKERIGEVYNALTDALQAKNPNAFLFEFAWHSKGCGEPCPNERMLPNELMTLGGDVLEERTVPEELRNPEPPELTEEEKKKQDEELKEMKPAERAKEKKQREEDRKELARRKALLERQNYFISRLHYRYDASTLPKDVELGPAGGHIKGGVELPKGMDRVVPTAAKPADRSQFQVRLQSFFPWDGMMKCEKPDRWRWGKRWRHLRVWNKIWVAVDLPSKKRDELKLTDVVKTPVPELGLPGRASNPADAGADAGAAVANEKKAGCGCRSVGRDDASSVTALSVALLGLCTALRRRRRR